MPRRCPSWLPWFHPTSALPFIITVASVFISLEKRQSLKMSHFLQTGIVMAKTTTRQDNVPRRYQTGTLHAGVKRLWDWLMPGDQNHLIVAAPEFRSTECEVKIKYKSTSYSSAVKASWFATYTTASCFLYSPVRISARIMFAKYPRATVLAGNVDKLHTLSDPSRCSTTN